MRARERETDIDLSSLSLGGASLPSGVRLCVYIYIYRRRAISAQQSTSSIFRRRQRARRASGKIVNEIFEPRARKRERELNVYFSVVEFQGFDVFAGKRNGLDWTLKNSWLRDLIRESRDLLGTIFWWIIRDVFPLGLYC